MAGVLPFKVVAFDLDGTLLRDTTVSQYLADWLGRGEEMVALERRYLAREISNAGIAEVSAEWFRGVHLTDVWEVLDAAPWIAGIEPTVGALHESGVVAAVATVTWRFAAERLRLRFGFDAVSGTEMGLREGRLSGRVARHFDARDKVGFVRRLCTERGLSLAECSAVGDSLSDVPLFEEAGLSIALNATPAARAAAHRELATDDLADVLPLILEPAPQVGRPRQVHTRFAARKRSST